MILLECMRPEKGGIYSDEVLATDKGFDKGEGASYPKRFQRETPRLEDSKMRGMAYKAMPRAGGST
jgi:hypothetical protein